MKSILHNKDETPVVKEDAIVQETVFSTANPPKDVLELKHDKAKKVYWLKSCSRSLSLSKQVFPTCHDML